jgi:hypothetical protein
MRFHIAVLIALAAAGTGFASIIDIFKPENLNLLTNARSLTFVCKAERDPKQFDPCLAEPEERCDKEPLLSVREYYVPVRDTARQRWCETRKEVDLPLVLPNVLVTAAPLESASEAPEVPSFLIVGSGLLLFRIRPRRRA